MPQWSGAWRLARPVTVGPGNLERLKVPKRSRPERGSRPNEAQPGWRGSNCSGGVNAQLTQIIEPTSGALTIFLNPGWPSFWAHRGAQGSLIHARALNTARPLSSRAQSKPPRERRLR